MLSTRIIPCLLLKNAGLVKTVKFANAKYVGDPINVVKIFNEKEVDELVLLDITASKERRAPNFELIEQIVSEAFMPVCYGGGITKLEDARRLLKLGVEKVSINSALISKPKLIEEIANEFGAQAIVASIDVKRTLFGRFEVYSQTKEKLVETNPERWAQMLVSRGAGELLLTSVDRDGTMQGYDLELLRRFNGKVKIPIVACGGACSIDNMHDALQVCRLSGLGVGARFVYQGPHRAVLISYLSAAEIDAIRAR